ncbi:hypothetical protein LCGC14_2469120, partial [marine sediment metagenome]
MTMVRPDRRREAIFKSLRFVSDSEYIGGEKRLRNVPYTVRVCEETRFLDWCHQKDMDILVTCGPVMSCVSFKQSPDLVTQAPPPRIRIRHQVSPTSSAFPSGIEVLAATWTELPTGWFYLFHYRSPQQTQIGHSSASSPSCCNRPWLIACRHSSGKSHSDIGCSFRLLAAALAASSETGVMQ